MNLAVFSLFSMEVFFIQLVCVSECVVFIYAAIAADQVKAIVKIVKAAKGI